jgi:hypothetical protein
MGYIQGGWTPTKRRGPIAAEFTGPGPAAVGLPSFIGQGDPTKSKSPSYTISGRPRDHNSFITPAPGVYRPEKCDQVVHEMTPKYSFGVRVRGQKQDMTPAPNSYTIPNALGPHRMPNLPQPPSFTITGKGRATPPPQTPGPNAYRVPTPDSYKVQSPRYTMSPKTSIPNDKTKIPGPGAHSPEKSLPSIAPAFTFGSKHSVYIAQFLERSI